MKNVLILDCTLRDGGYINNWNFGKDKISFILDKINESNIDYIELGYYTKTRKTTQDTTLYDNLVKVDKKLKSKNNVIMINYGEVDIEDVPSCNEIKNIDIIRLAFHKKDYKEAIEYCKKLQNKGWSVFVQPMVTMIYSDEEFKNLILEVNKLNPDAMYIVDSFGTMTSKDVAEKFNILDSMLNKDINIGFHSHNNLQLSYSNIITLLDMNIDRNVYLDSSIYGMGRGAGNLNTELIINYLNLKGHNYNSYPLLEIIDEYIKEEKERHQWGYCIEYYLSAIYDCHPNYARFLADIHTLNISDINEILKNISESKKSTYSEDYIKKLYVAYLNHIVDDKESYIKLKNLLCNKKIIILGGGRSLIDNQEEINELISNDSIVISLNTINEIYDTDIIFTSNKRRFNEIRDKEINQLLMCTSNIVDEVSSKVIVFDYFSNLAKEYEINDNVLLIFLNILKKAGIKDVYLCGFDGFDYGENNYYSDELSYRISKENIEKMNNDTKKYVKLYKKDININWATKSKYEE